MVMDDCPSPDHQCDGTHVPLVTVELKYNQQPVKVATLKTEDDTWLISEVRGVNLWQGKRDGNKWMFSITLMHQIRSDVFILGFDQITMQESRQQSGCTLLLLIYWLMSGRMRVGPWDSTHVFCCVHTWLLSRDFNPPFYKLSIHKNEVMWFPILFYCSALLSSSPTCFCYSKQKQVGDYYHNYVKSDEIISLGPGQITECRGWGS